MLINKKSQYTPSANQHLKQPSPPFRSVRVKQRSTGTTRTFKRQRVSISGLKLDMLTTGTSSRTISGRQPTSKKMTTTKSTMKNMTLRLSSYSTSSIQSGHSGSKTMRLAHQKQLSLHPLLTCQPSRRLTHPSLSKKNPLSCQSRHTNQFSRYTSSRNLILSQNQMLPLVFYQTLQTQGRHNLSRRTSNHTRFMSNLRWSRRQSQ
jgi:hypothetical protein